MVVPRPDAGWLGRALARQPLPPPDPEQVPLDDLLEALAAGRLLTRYQPVVRLADGVPIGLEVLARLEHPALGTLPPDCFVPQIEAAGFAARLTELVARRAFAEWSGDSLSRLGLRLAVNLPLDVLLLPGAAERMEAWRQAAGIAPGRIVVELTETHPIGRPDLLRPVLQRLRAAGYGLAIDDVGPDMRDYQDLIGLPFTSMKLDKAVVRDSATSPARAAVPDSSAIAAARTAGMKVIAEGVEDDADWARMASLGVDAGAGISDRPSADGGGGRHLARRLAAPAGGMSPLPVPAPAQGGNACGGMDADELALLATLADRYLAARDGFTGFLEWAGQYAERGLAFLPADWRAALHARAREALAWAWQRAIAGMDRAPTGRAAPTRLFRLLTAGSGAVTGAAGLAGVLADLPASTLLVLRSLAAIARARGLDIDCGRCAGGLPGSVRLWRPDR